MKKNISKKSKLKIFPIILALVLITAAVFGIKEYTYFKHHVDTDDAQIDGEISPVIARVGGYVDSIYFEENTFVKKGQLLVKIDDRDLKIKLEQAESSLKSVESNVDVSKSNVSISESSLGVIQANIDAANSKAEQAEKNYVRYANLIKDKSITQQQFDAVKADRDAARAQFRATQSQYAQASRQISAAKTQVGATSTGIASKQADVDFSKLQLSYTKIYAPTSGIVSKKSIQNGQLVQAGQNLFAIVDRNQIYVTANFKETQLEKLAEGKPVKIEVDAYPNAKITGTVDKFSGATGAKFSLLPPDNASGNYVKVVQRVPVKILIKGDEKVVMKLRPGMSVKVSVNID